MSKLYTTSRFESMMISNGKRARPRFVLYVLMAAAWIQFDEDEEYADAKRALDREQHKGNCAVLYDQDTECYIA